MMSKIICIDHHPTIIKEIEKLFPGQVIFQNTTWNERTARTLKIYDEPQIIFYSPFYEKLTGSSSHIIDGNLIDRRIKEGSVLIIFVGKCGAYHIENISGLKSIVQFEYQIVEKEPSLIDVLNTPFKELFSRFGNDISYCVGLLNTRHESVLPFNQDQLGTQVIALHKFNKIPIALYVKEKESRGFILLLPFFGFQSPVIDYIVNKLLPSISPYLYFDEKSSWLNQEKYYIPKLILFIKEKEKLIKEHTVKIEIIDKEINMVLEEEQKSLNQLLITKGDELKYAVKKAFEYLGWYVVDPDLLEGGKKLKEEDLWLLNSSEYNLSKDDYIIVEVKGDIKRGASDDDCNAILKYLNRHLRTYKNMSVKGLFVYNHSYGLPIENRPKPFSPKQHEDAVSSNYGLMTTYTLFQYIKAELEGSITKDRIKAKMKDSTGEIPFAI